MNFLNLLTKKLSLRISVICLATGLLTLMIGNNNPAIGQSAPQSSATEASSKARPKATPNSATKGPKVIQSIDINMADAPLLKTTPKPTEKPTTRPNRRAFDHIGNFNQTKSQTKTSGNFFDDMMEGTNIKRNDSTTDSSSNATPKKATPSPRTKSLDTKQRRRSTNLFDGEFFEGEFFFDDMMEGSNIKRKQPTTAASNNAMPDDLDGSGDRVMNRNTNEPQTNSLPKPIQPSVTPKPPFNGYQSGAHGHNGYQSGAHGHNGYQSGAPGHNLVHAGGGWDPTTAYQSGSQTSPRKRSGQNEAQYNPKELGVDKFAKRMSSKNKVSPKPKASKSKRSSKTLAKNPTSFQEVSGIGMEVTSLRKRSSQIQSQYNPKELGVDKIAKRMSSKNKVSPKPKASKSKRSSSKGKN